MSYTVYKNRLCLETEDGQVLPLILIADSSLRTNSGKMVRSWSLASFRFIGENEGILYDKNEYLSGIEKGIHAFVKKKNENAKRYMERFPQFASDEEITINSQMDGSDWINGKIPTYKQFATYLKNLVKNYSISIDEFCRKYGSISLSLEFCDENYKNISSKHFVIRSDSDLTEADAWYRDNNKDNLYGVVRIEGISEDIKIRKKRRG